MTKRGHQIFNVVLVFAFIYNIAFTYLLFWPADFVNTIMHAGTFNIAWHLICIFAISYAASLLPDHDIVIDLLLDKKKRQLVLYEIFHHYEVYLLTLFIYAPLLAVFLLMLLVLPRKYQQAIVKHRGFSHSLLGLLFFTGLAYLTYPISFARLLCTKQIFLVAFLLGYAGHIIADMMTYSGVHLLFPLYKKYTLKYATDNDRALSLGIKYIIVISSIYTLVIWAIWMYIR